jgi:hypothetical protein
MADATVDVYDAILHAAPVPHMVNRRPRHRSRASLSERRATSDATGAA